MLVAVASTTGENVDLHFGKAERFLIYDYGSGKPEPMTEVVVEKYCSSDPDHSFHDERFSAITSALEGCKALVTEMIGDMPRQELEKAGITPVITSGSVADALKLAHDSVCSGPCNKKSGSKPCPHK